jgi:hypothetical protein
MPSSGKYIGFPRQPRSCPPPPKRPHPTVGCSAGAILNFDQTLRGCDTTLAGRSRSGTASSTDDVPSTYDAVPSASLGHLVATYTTGKPVIVVRFLSGARQKASLPCVFIGRTTKKKTHGKGFVSRASKKCTTHTTKYFFHFE